MQMSDGFPWVKTKGNLEAIFAGGFHALSLSSESSKCSAPEFEFEKVLREAGLVIDGAVIGDGKIHRCRSLDDNKRGRKTGWYVLYMDGVPAGAYGDYRTSDEGTPWCAKGGNELTAEELANNKRRMEEARRQRAEELAVRYSAAAQVAEDVASMATPASSDHPYLIKKQAKPSGALQVPPEVARTAWKAVKADIGEDASKIPSALIKARKPVLVLPLQKDGKITTVQFITEHGEKLLLPGGEKRGAFMLLGKPGRVIYEAEGFATAATIQEVTGEACAMAIDRTNLEGVAQSLRSKYPTSRLIICADNDQFTDGNPGIQGAEKAAKAVGAETISPTFSDITNKPTDFNDLLIEEGAEAVKEQLTLSKNDLGMIRASGWAGVDPVERQWLVRDWMPTRQTTALYARGGTGKTLATQQLLTAVASGSKWLGMDVKKGPCVGVFCEDDQDELHRRQDGINAALGVAWDDLQDLHILPRVGFDNLLMTFDSTGHGSLTPFWHQLFNELEAIDPVLVVIDTAADTFGGNENIRPQVRQYVQQALTQIATKLDCSVVLCAHPSMSGINSGEGTGGSTAWENSVRSRLYMDRDESTKQITLTRKKSNYSAIGDAIELFWHEGALKTKIDCGGILNSTDQQIETAFFYLLDHVNEKQKQNVSASKNGNYAPRIFSVLCNQLGIRSWSIKQFEEAMNRLLDQERIKVNKTGNGTTGLARNTCG